MAENGQKWPKMAKNNQKTITYPLRLVLIHDNADASVRVRLAVVGHHNLLFGPKKPQMTKKCQK